MRKNLIGQIVITKEEKKAYENLENTIRDKDKTLEDRENSIKRKKEELKEKDNLIAGLEVKLSSVANDLRAEYESKLKIKEEQLESLKRDRNKYVGKCGGYQKEQNKNHQQIDSLKSELAKALEKINNYQKQLKDDHVQVSPNQYDKKIKTVAQHQKNLARCK